MACREGSEMAMSVFLLPRGCRRDVTTSQARPLGGGRAQRARMKGSVLHTKILRPPQQF